MSVDSITFDTTGWIRAYGVVDMVLWEQRPQSRSSGDAVPLRISRHQSPWMTNDSGLEPPGPVATRPPRRHTGSSFLPTPVWAFCNKLKASLSRFWRLLARIEEADVVLDGLNHRLSPSPFRAFLWSHVTAHRATPPVYPSSMAALKAYPPALRGVLLRPYYRPVNSANIRRHGGAVTLHTLSTNPHLPPHRIDLVIYPSCTLYQHHVCGLTIHGAWEVIAGGYRFWAGLPLVLHHLIDYTLPMPMTAPTLIPPQRRPCCVQRANGSQTLASSRKLSTLPFDISTYILTPVSPSHPGSLRRWGWGYNRNDNAACSRYHNADTAYRERKRRPEGMRLVRRRGGGSDS
ncbi:hypothetical protein FB45DRAFT_1058303 [Roridomyces roridus]|uniref:Uncharacterized protein n=1 Tax=Roridomyces roridus TaxID=1738132 RepID=A0AAD7FP30_9AGAR|nr:hypothetical protein FB45DRAFT_1058303 [Roridomyces roridus]